MFVDAFLLCSPRQPEAYPTPSELAIMHRAHKLIVEADNPAALESRLLLSSASQPRYAFLRSGGRHHAVWIEIRSGRLREQKAPVAGPLVGNYASDDSDAGEPSTIDPPLPPKPAPSPPAPPPSPTAAETSAKQARAREWAERRKQAREASGVT